MIKLVSICHHFIPSAGFGGPDFCCKNVNHEAALSLVCFQSLKDKDPNAEIDGSFWQVGGNLYLRENPALTQIFICTSFEHRKPLAILDEGSSSR